VRHAGAVIAIGDNAVAVWHWSEFSRRDRIRTPAYVLILVVAFASKNFLVQHGKGIDTVIVAFLYNGLLTSATFYGFLSLPRRIRRSSMRHSLAADGAAPAVYS